jgi:hypothetical protein
MTVAGTIARMRLPPPANFGFETGLSDLRL